MIHLQVVSRLKFPIDRKLIRQAAKLTLQVADGNEICNLTILVTEDNTLQRLNLLYLGIDRPTDVLSFPSGEVDPQTGKKYLGDVIISYVQAAMQAKKGGHAVSSELQLLTVHGILHLLGFDHGNPRDKKRMWTIQETILNKLGLPGSLIQEADSQ